MVETSPRAEIAKARVAKLLQEKTSGYVYDPKMLDAAWRGAGGDERKGQARLAAYMVSQRVRKAGLLEYHVSLRDGGLIRPSPSASARETAVHQQRADRARVYGAIVLGVEAWQQAFNDEYTRVPDYPDEFFRDGVEPPDLTVRKLDLPKYMDLHEQTRVLGFAPQGGKRDPSPHSRHGAVRVLLRHEQSLARDYRGDDVPDSILDFRAALILAADLTTFIVQSRPE